MRRIALVLTVAMLMAMMMLSAGPAKADVFDSDNDFGNQQLVVIYGGDHGSGGDWWGCCHRGWGSHGWSGYDIELSGFEVEFG